MSAVANCSRWAWSRNSAFKGWGCPHPPQRPGSTGANPIDRARFLRLVWICEGGAIGLALILGWLLNVRPIEQIHLTWRGVGEGILALGPMSLLLISTAAWDHWKPLARIRDFIRDQLGPALAECSVFDLFVTASLAGIGEELLFRGVLQPLMGLWWSNLVFGLLHAVTPLYAILAGGVGVYLGYVSTLTDNLLPPILAHAVYDFIGLWMVRREALVPSTAMTPSDRSDHDTPTLNSLSDETSP